NRNEREERACSCGVHASNQSHRAGSIECGVRNAECGMPSAECGRRLPNIEGVLKVERTSLLVGADVRRLILFRPVRRKKDQSLLTSAATNGPVAVGLSFRRGAIYRPACVPWRPGCGRVSGGEPFPGGRARPPDGLCAPLRSCPATTGGRADD